MGNPSGIDGNALRVTASVGVLCLDQRDEGAECVPVCVGQLLIRQKCLSCDTKNGTASRSELSSPARPMSDRHHYAQQRRALAKLAATTGRTIATQTRSTGSPREMEIAAPYERAIDDRPNERRDQRRANPEREIRGHAAGLKGNPAEKNEGESGKTRSRA